MADSGHGPITVSDPDNRVNPNERAGAQARPSTPYDTLPEESFDRIARMAAAALRSPVAIVSLVDGDRQIVKSSIGLTGRSKVWRKIPVALQYARQVVLSARPVFIGNSAESMAHAGPDRVGNDGVAYALVPIKTPDGQAIGTICVADTAPHEWTHSEITCLTDIAAVLASELELRTDISLR